MTLLAVFFLYLAFRLKQYICDFVLQTNWMGTQKGSPSVEGYKALALHIVYHGLGTLIVVLVFMPSLWWLAIIDIIIHGVIDKSKAMLNNIKKIKDSQRAFWLFIGFDQELHNLTHLSYIMFMIFKAGGVVLG